MIALGSEMNKEMVAAANIPHISFHDIRRTISTGMKNWASRIGLLVLPRHLPQVSKHTTDKRNAAHRTRC